MLKCLFNKHYEKPITRMKHNKLSQDIRRYKRDEIKKEDFERKPRKKVKKDNMDAIEEEREEYELPKE